MIPELGTFCFNNRAGTGDCAGRRPVYHRPSDRRIHNPHLRHHPSPAYHSRLCRVNARLYHQRFQPLQCRRELPFLQTDDLQNRGNLGQPRGFITALGAYFSDIRRGGSHPHPRNPRFHRPRFIRASVDNNRLFIIFITGF